MSYLHKNNVLFRDLKCSNLLLISTAVDAPVNCKLTDFGTARNVENLALVKNYTCGLGTPVYMAPEVLSTKPYNFKVDIYSFGMCLWELWMRDELWAEVPCWDIPRKVAGGARPDFDEECPKQYTQLAQRCWAQNAEERPEFPDIATTLAQILEEARPDLLAHTQQPAAADDAEGGVSMAAATGSSKTVSRPRTRRTKDFRRETAMLSMTGESNAGGGADAADATGFKQVAGKDQQRLNAARGAKDKDKE
ncbi:Serine/threonine-protein kinase HT1 [Pelomyxa schiedti]|nr:Serine/threonine-protein kinase HT1 [Pelomyxa schiedti]